MINISCIICKSRRFKLIWNDKIRSGRKSFTQKNEKIFKCINCELIFLKNRRKNLENSAVARNIYNQNNSIKEFVNFHKPREIQKVKFLENYIQIKNKRILESNCGSGVLLSRFKKKAKITAGLDDHIYKDHLIKKGHNFYGSLDEIKKNKVKFDIIFSLSELEHKYDPVNFLIRLNKILYNKGILIIRVPNFNNIYKTILGKSFFKYDYRTSHNYYFSLKNLSRLFKITKFKTLNVFGYQEYDINHLLAYIKSKKRVGSNYNKIFSKKDIKFVKNNIEKDFYSTSLIYILKKK